MNAMSRNITGKCTGRTRLAPEKLARGRATARGVVWLSLACVLITALPLMTYATEIRFLDPMPRGDDGLGAILEDGVWREPSALEANQFPPGCGEMPCECCGSYDCCGCCCPAPDEPAGPEEPDDPPDQEESRFPFGGHDRTHRHGIGDGTGVDDGSGFFGAVQVVLAAESPGSAEDSHDQITDIGAIGLTSLPTARIPSSVSLASAGGDTATTLTSRDRLAGFGAAAVPEPATLALLGFGGLVAICRRRWRPSG